jgi:hypothetical protein
VCSRDLDPDPDPTLITCREKSGLQQPRKGEAPALQGNDERDTTLNQLLSEMDGFGDGGGPVVCMSADALAFCFVQQLTASRGSCLPMFLTQTAS